MKQIPILFSTQMVQAILEGRKTMTRRIVKPQPIDNTEVDGNFFEGNHKGYVKVDGHPNWKEQFAFEFCKYQKGNILWVREAFRKYILFDPGEEDLRTEEIIDYVADGLEPIPMIDGDGFGIFKKDGSEKFIPIRPSIHMPKSAARIWLEVTDVRVERLHDISINDAIKEGIRHIQDEWYVDYAMPTIAVNAYDSFASLWIEINGAESLDANPWLWVVSFKVLSTTGKPENL